MSDCQCMANKYLSYKLGFRIVIGCLLTIGTLAVQAQTSWGATASEGTSTATPVSTVTPLPVPSLPPLPTSTPLDFSPPPVTVPQATFALPEHLSVNTGDTVESPADLKVSDWEIIVRITNSLKADRMDKADPQHPEASLGQAPVLVWKGAKDTAAFLTFTPSGSMDAEVSYSEATSNFVTCGYDEESASASYLYCSGSFARSHEEKHARSQATKKVYMNGTWSYPAGIVDLDQCTEVSPVFEKAVEDALNGRGFPANPDPNDHSVPPRDGVKAVFDYFGQAVPSRVTIGAQLMFTSSAEASATSTEDDIKDTIRGAVGLQVGKAGGSGSASFTTTKQKKITAAELKSKFRFVPLGGDKRKSTDPNAWALTTDKWKLWTVIRKWNVRPTYTLLRKNLRDRVLALWPQVCPIVDGADLAWQESKEEYSETSGFVIATRYPTRGVERGSVTVYSGKSEGLGENAQEAAGGAAFMHNNGNTDNYYSANSVCIPVPQSGYYVYDFKDQGGRPGGRLLYVPSFLRLQDWTSLDDAPIPVSKDDDGFLFVSIKANPARPANPANSPNPVKPPSAESGSVLAKIDGKVMAGASVQASRSTNAAITPSAFMSQESFCIPVPARAKIEWEVTPTEGNPEVRAHWLPFQKDNVLRMGKTETRNVNTTYPRTETAGFVYGYIEASTNGDRGSLKVYCPAEKRPEAAAASVYKKHKGDSTAHVRQLGGLSVSHFRIPGYDRIVWCNSVFFPVPKGARYRVELQNAKGSPTPHIYWTPLLPQ